jgi:hypothetical protein
MPDYFTIVHDPGNASGTLGRLHAAVKPHGSERSLAVQVFKSGNENQTITTDAVTGYGRSPNRLLKAGDGAALVHIDTPVEAGLVLVTRANGHRSMLEVPEVSRAQGKKFLVPRGGGSVFLLVGNPTSTDATVIARAQNDQVVAQVPPLQVRRIDVPWLHSAVEVDSTANVIVHGGLGNHLDITTLTPLPTA